MRIGLLECTEVTMLSAGLGGSGRLKLSAHNGAASEVILCGKKRCPGCDYQLMS